MHQTTRHYKTDGWSAHLPQPFASTAPKTPGSVTFLCDAKHSCDDDHLVATYLSVNATDQIDVTDRFKIRAGVRQDWWDTSLLPLVTVPTSVTSVPPNLAPGAFNNNGQPIIAGQEENTNTQPVELEHRRALQAYAQRLGLWRRFEKLAVKFQLRKRPTGHSAG